MGNPRGVWRKVGMFYGLTLVLSLPFYLLIIHAGKLLAGDRLFVFGLMWCPALAAFVTQFLHGEHPSAFGWGWGKTRYQLLSYLIPLAYTTAVYGLVWGTGLGGFYNASFVKEVAEDFGWDALSPGWVIAAYVALRSVVGMVRASAAALGEEIGWRGFLVPQLVQVTGFTNTALISGFMWAAWHYPLLLLVDYNSRTPPWYGLACFTVMIVAMSFLFAWMRLRSGSLWTGMFLHASHNLFVQLIFTPLTTDTGITRYVIDEFGVGLAIATSLVGVAVWRMRSHVALVIATPARASGS